MPVVEAIKAQPKSVALQHARVGLVLKAMLLTRLPELGQVDRHAIAKLVGVASLNCESGMIKRQRHIWAGRGAVRTVLYMAALVAAMRKLLVILNARMRDFLTRQAAGEACAIG
jgi:hypothetical protein